MGKKSKFTGSKLLGAELRRLRGDRSLAQISALSRSEPLSERINPISAPALSQIETGVSFPSLDTLHSLATLYQTPMQQLLDFVVQERVLESTDFALPESHEEVKAAFREAFGCEPPPAELLAEALGGRIEPRQYLAKVLHFEAAVLRPLERRGLEPGLRVVTAGAAYLSEGQKVTLLKQTEQAEPAA